jgi:tetratricopeptide (TPR) repeat protein
MKGLVPATLLVATVLVVAADRKDVSPLYADKSPQDAAAALLAKAEEQAGRGSWELIAVGRVRYLSGDKPGGQALFDRAISRKTEASDLRRIALVYVEAGDLDLAAKTCEKGVELNPRGPAILAECGAIFNLNGDRAHAEELFERAFSAGADVWDTLAVAASYLKVRPQS